MPLWVAMNLVVKLCFLRIDKHCALLTSLAVLIITNLMGPKVANGEGETSIHSIS